MTTTPSEPEIRSALAHYAEPLRSAQIHGLGDNAGFSGACVWRVEIGDRSLALRATSDSAVQVERLRALHRLLAWVNRLGVTEVPAPFVWPSGGTLFSAFGHIWQLEPWMPGTADYDARPSRERLISAMHLLARFHQAAAKFPTLPDEQTWFVIARQPSPGLNERLRHTLRWDRHACAEVRAALLSSNWLEFGTLGVRILELYQRSVGRVTESLLLAREQEIPLQPCLRDVWHDHVLFTGDVVTGMIDAHASRSDCVATDLARLLGTMVGDDLAAWDFAVQVYQEIRPLSLEERLLIPLFDQSGVLLNGLTWLDWHVRGREFPHPQRVIKRLQEIAARLERLAARS